MILVAAVSVALVFAAVVLIGQWWSWRQWEREDAERLTARQSRAIASLGPHDRRFDTNEIEGE